MEKMDGYDTWKLSSEYDDDPETIEKECTQCGRIYDGYYNDIKDCPYCSNKSERDYE